MLAILLWTAGIISIIYLIGFFLFAGLLLTCLVGGYRSWSEVKKSLIWALSWPSWAPRTIWYLWGNDFMRDF